MKGLLNDAAFAVLSLHLNVGSSVIEACTARLCMVIEEPVKGLTAAFGFRVAFCGKFSGTMLILRALIKIVDDCRSTLPLPLPLQLKFVQWMSVHALTAHTFHLTLSYKLIASLRPLHRNIKLLPNHWNLNHWPFPPPFPLSKVQFSNGGIKFFDLINAHFMLKCLQAMLNNINNAGQNYMLKQMYFAMNRDHPEQENGEWSCFSLYFSYKLIP